MIRYVILLAALPIGSSEYYWKEYSDPEYAHWVGLWQGQSQLGGYNRQSQQYQPILGRSPLRWGPAGTPPVPVPAHLRRWESQPNNYGIDVAKLGHGYSINGKSATKKQAYEFLQKRSLADDSSRLRLTVIGTAEQCRAVLDDLADPQIKTHLGDTIVSAYRPDHWHVDGVFARGAPAIYYQKPTGEVLCRLKKHPGKKVIGEVLRRGRPDYDPSKDPDADDLIRPDRPILRPGGKLKLDLAAVPSYVWAVAGAGVVFLLMKRGS